MTADDKPAPGRVIEHWRAELDAIHADFTRAIVHADANAATEAIERMRAFEHRSFGDTWITDRLVRALLTLHPKPDGEA